MILVMGHMRLPGGVGAAAREVLAAHMAASLAEAGCDYYNFAFDAGDADLVRVAERWDSAEALAAHGRADHQKAFGRALRDLGVLEISVKAWEGGFWRTLIGE